MAFILAAIILLAGCLGDGETDVFYGDDIVPPIPVQDFILIDEGGEYVSLSQYEGKVVVVAFLFTRCPDICPVVSANLAFIVDRLGERHGTEVQILSITVDPWTDNSSVMHDYASTRGLGWPHLTGELDDLEPVWMNFDVGLTTYDSDVDGDGVADGFDSCPDTPPGEAVDDADRRARIRWLLGEPPASFVGEKRTDFISPEESAMMTHDRWRAGGTSRTPVRFGAGVRGNLYFKTKTDKPAPAVIWLHPYSYHSGYNEGYGVQGTTVYHRLAAAGYVVLAYDQCGFGLRLLEGRDFYKKAPHWSRLGRMVADVSAAADFLIDGKGAAQGVLPKIAPGKVYVLGFSVGGLAGLYAAALDERLAGVASFGGFTPMRSDTSAATGGLRRLWKWHALAPRLGLFDGSEEKVPFDYHDVLSLVAPRPCLVYAARRDRELDPKAVSECIERARKVWKAGGDPEGLEFHSPADIGRFQQAQHELFLRGLRGRG